MVHTFRNAMFVGVPVSTLLQIINGIQVMIRVARMAITLLLKALSVIQNTVTRIHTAAQAGIRIIAPLLKIFVVTSPTTVSIESMVRISFPLLAVPPDTRPSVPSILATIQTNAALLRKLVRTTSTSI